MDLQLIVGCLKGDAAATPHGVTVVSVSATECSAEYAVELAAQVEEKRDDLGRLGYGTLGSDGEHLDCRFEGRRGNNFTKSKKSTDKKSQGAMTW